jgi:anti-sigma-K factor RskA
VVITVAVLLAAAIFTAIAWPARWRTIRSSVHDYRWWLALAAVVAVAILVLLLVNKLLQRPWGAPWRVNVLAAADALHYELDALPAAATPAEQDLRRSVGEAVEHHLKAARKAAWPEEKKRLSVGEQFLDWWTSAPCEAAYVNLHEAEIALAQILPDYQIQARIPEALARLQTMDVTDPRRLAAETQLASNLSESQRQAAFQSATRIGLELKDQQYDRLRAFRNIVLATAAALALLVAAACLVGAWRPDALPLCFGPPPTTTPGGVPPPVQGPSGVACPSEDAPPSPGTKARRLPAPGDVTLVAFLGLLGGGLSAALFLRGLQGTSTPYDVPVALALLKLPSGALSALVGLLFVRGGFVPGLSQLDSQPQILAYAFLFGIAQQFVTRLVDQQAQDILTKVPSKEPVSTKPQPSPTEGTIPPPAAPPAAPPPAAPPPAAPPPAPT